MSSSSTFASAFDWLHHYQKQETRFKMITRLTVNDAMEFYLAFGRFPNEKETDAINVIGLDMTVRLIQSGKAEESFAKMKTLKTDFEKLEPAKFRLGEACKAVLKKFFNFKS